MLLHVHAAVHLDDLSRHVRRHVGSEECGDICNVFRSAAAAQWNFLAPFLFDFVREFGSHVGDDEARGDAVGADAARTHLLGDRLGKTEHAGFRRRVVALARVAADAHHGRHVDEGCLHTFEYGILQIGL